MRAGKFGAVVVVAAVAGLIGARSAFADPIDVAAKVQRSQFVYAGSAEAVSSAPQTIHRFFGTELYSPQATVIGAQITLGPRTMTYDPALPTPATIGPQDVPTGSDLSLPLGSVSDITGSIGFDASRTLTRSGSDMTAHYTITSTNPDATTLAFNMDCGNGGQVASTPSTIAWPTLTHGEFVNYEQVQGSYVTATIFSISEGVPYTFDVTCANVPAGTYKPSADLETGADQTANSVGTSVDITDPEQGGTFTFSSSDTVTWQSFLVDNWGVSFESISPAPFTASLDQSSYTVQAGSIVSPHATVAVPLGYSNAIGLGLAGDDGSGNPGPTPAGINQDGPWSSVNVAGVLDEDVPVGVEPGTAPGTYHLLLRAWAIGGPGEVDVPFTLTVTPGPDYTTSLDQTTYEVHAGQSFSPQLTITPANGLTGTFGFWLTTAGANPPTFPSGFYQVGPFPTADVSGTSPVTVSLPIGTDNSLAPGTYQLELGSNDQSAFFPDKRTAFTLIVDAALPQVNVDDVQYREVTMPAGVDSIAANDVNIGTKYWYIDAYSWGGSAAHDVTLSLDGSTLAWSPAISFPLSITRATLASGDDMQLPQVSRWQNGSSSVPNQSISSGYDLTRSVSPQVIPPGGGTQTVTLTITPRDPSLAGQLLSLSTWTDSFAGGTQIDPSSIVWPTLANGEGSDHQVYDTSIFVSLWGVQIGTPYSLTYQVHVPNSTPGSMTWDPGVQAEGFYSTILPDANGTSFSYTDSDLGGTITATSSDDVQWSNEVNYARDVILTARADNSIKLDHFRVQLTSPTINSGTPTGVRITALDAAGNRVAAYPGGVELDGSLGEVLTSSLTWSGGIGTGTVTFPDPFVNQTLQAFDVSGINWNATGISTPFQVYGPLDHFKAFLTPASATVGSPVRLTVMAQDAVNHTLPLYAGSPTLTFSDLSAPAPTWPALSWSHGVGTGNVTFNAATHADVVTVQDGTASGLTPAFNVVGGLDHLKVQTAVTGLAVGSPLTVYVTAYDAMNNPIAGYNGSSLTLADDNAAGTWSGGTWSNGLGRYTVTFAAPQAADHVTATDGPTSISGVSGAFNAFGALDHLKVQMGSTSVAAGAPMTVYVTGLDSIGNAVQTYAGGGLFVSDLAPGSVWSAFTWNKGLGRATLTVPSAFHADVVTASAGVAPAVSTAAFNVYGALDHFKVQPAASAVSAGAPLVVYVTALDSLNDAIPNYTGPSLTVHDAAPGSSFSAFTWSNGLGRSSLTVPAPYHADVVTATDGTVSSVSGAFNIVGPLDHFNVTLSTAAVHVGVPITVYATPVDVLDDTVPGYSTTLSISDLSHNGVFGPVTWTSIARLSATFPSTFAGDRITVTGDGHTGVSPAFTIR